MTSGSRQSNAARRRDAHGCPSWATCDRQFPALAAVAPARGRDGPSDPRLHRWRPGDADDGARGAVLPGDQRGSCWPRDTACGTSCCTRTGRRCCDASRATSFSGRPRSGSDTWTRTPRHLSSGCATRRRSSTPPISLPTRLLGGSRRPSGLEGDPVRAAGSAGQRDTAIVRCQAEVREHQPPSPTSPFGTAARCRSRCGFDGPVDLLHEVLEVRLAHR